MSPAPPDEAGTEPETEPEPEAAGVDTEDEPPPDVLPEDAGLLPQAARTRPCLLYTSRCV